MTTSFLRIALLVLPLAAFGCAGSDITGSGPGSGANGGNESGSGNGSGNGTSNGGGSGSGGSGSGSAIEGLFTADPGSPATPDSIFGVWGGSMKELSITFDTRMKITGTTVTFGTRCLLEDGRESAVVGVTAAARVTSENIAVLESKKDEKNTGGVTCRASSRPGETKRCAKVDGFQTDCFHLDGTQLTIYGTSPFDKLTLTKISD